MNDSPRGSVWAWPLVVALLGPWAAAAEPAAGGWAEIQVVDAATGRGVPLVELETVNGLKFVTDNAGRIALAEPGLLGREVYFSIRSHGYDVPRDGFGFAGAKLTPRVGQPATVKLQRRNLAERLCRLTGEGRWRDSVLLGRRPAAEDAALGNVAGQDSVQVAERRGEQLWIWGDTNRLAYPLGLYRAAGAVTRLQPDFDPEGGIPFEYFVDASGFARAMLPLPERPAGVIWISALCIVPDERGAERIVAHYSRRKGLAEELEQGLALFDDERHAFQPLRTLPLEETWRRPSGHPIAHEEAGTRWLLFGSPTPNVRVRATLADLREPDRYEAFTCAVADAQGKPAPPPPRQPVVWRWQRELPPLDSKTERQWVQSGRLPAEAARFSPVDAAAPAERIELHSGTVRWNARRQRWVLIAGQVGGKPSLLGEVWYAEARAPTGPFARAVKVVTHDRYSFYNVCHHPFLDREQGRWIHFEGTYTREFSGNPERTPRYDYNQILYRLDLDAPALQAARAE